MRRTRDRVSTIRAQLTRIVLIPSLCFLALWLVVAAVGTTQAVRLMGQVTQAREGAQAYSSAFDALHNERRLSLVHLGLQESGSGTSAARSALDQQRERTDTALAAAVDAARSADGDDEVERRSQALMDGPDTVSGLRAGVDQGTTGREEALLGYGAVLDAVRSATVALVHTTDGGENLTDAVLTRELLDAASDYATADALLAGVIAAGEMTYAETAHFTYVTASYRHTLDAAAPDMHPGIRERYRDLRAADAWLSAEETSRRVVTRSPNADTAPEGAVTVPGAAGEDPAVVWSTGVGATGADWDSSSAVSLAALGGLARAQTDRTVDLAWSAALLRVSLGVAAAVVTLGAGAAAIAVVGRSSRRLTDRLTRLREQILDRDADLPGILDRAQRGRRVEVHEELPPMDERGDDEIGQVAEALDSAQLAAVGAAVRQAEIRRGANRAFLGIAFRNQALVQRQLRLLDEIEYREQDPDALRRLFHLDHLVTRARRYADNLIILGGGQSARLWRQPSPLVDVLRAAIAETEDYERVRLTSAPRVLMRGQVVSDIVHLVAELVENATQFSPAGTPVDVGCTPVPEGLVVEVEDRGLGMSEHGYASAERTLNQPPEFDVMALPDDPRLGLFVVARLAERHGVRVWLRPSPYGGTRATTLLPNTLLEPAENPAPVPGRPEPRHPGVPVTVPGTPGTGADETGRETGPEGDRTPPHVAPVSGAHRVSRPQAPPDPLGGSPSLN